MITRQDPCQRGGDREGPMTMRWDPLQQGRINNDGEGQTVKERDKQKWEGTYGKEEGTTAVANGWGCGLQSLFIFYSVLLLFVTRF